MRNDKKNLYILIMIITAFFITIGYAVLNSTLNINGKSNISKNTWDVHFDNVVVRNGSVEATKLPTIENNTTVNFETQLNLPGDFYEFTVDVVNNGTIDAMIESIEKTPVLTEEQAKYLNYIVTYENGVQITEKQLVRKEEFVRLKVKVEYKKDIAVSELPTIEETLNLGFSLNYIQSDETGINVKLNGKKRELEIISGDLETVGSEVAIGDEHFYIMSNVEGTVSLMAKYNLYVGGSFQNSTYTPYGEEATGIQNPDMRGWLADQPMRKGTINFSSTDYWSETVKNYPSYVYDSNSVLYSYVENYKAYLESLGAVIDDAHLITIDELISLGCNNSCSNSHNWLYSTSYWTGVANNFAGIPIVLCINSKGIFNTCSYDAKDYSGIRPIIILTI